MQEVLLNVGLLMYFQKHGELHMGPCYTMMLLQRPVRPLQTPLHHHHLEIMMQCLPPVFTGGTASTREANSNCRSMVSSIWAHTTYPERSVQSEMLPRVNIFFQLHLSPRGFAWRAPHGPMQEVPVVHPDVYVFAEAW